MKIAQVFRACPHDFCMSLIVQIVSGPKVFKTSWSTFTAGKIFGSSTVFNFVRIFHLNQNQLNKSYKKTVGLVKLVFRK